MPCGSDVPEQQKNQGAAMPMQDGGERSGAAHTSPTVHGELSGGGQQGAYHTRGRGDAYTRGNNPHQPQAVGGGRASAHGRMQSAPFARNGPRLRQRRNLRWQPRQQPCCSGAERQSN
eukprot:9107350-Lingulodinium_polyedra.AAC.1